MKILYASRSQGEADQRCRRERYWMTVYGGFGIVPAVEPIEFRFGTVVHNAMSLWDNPPAAAEMAYREMGLLLVAHPDETQKFEYPILAAAVVYAFLSRVFPFFLKDYVVEETEKDVVYVDEEGVKWPARPDFLLKRRKGEGRTYLELKTTSLDPETFSRVFQQRLQGHHGALAVSQTRGVEVEAIIMQGMHKGGKYQGSLRSRLLGGYRREGVPGTTRTAYRTSHAKGFEWFLATEYPPTGLEGLMAWIDQLPDDIIAEAFPQTPPVVPNLRKLTRFMRQRRHREKEIAQFRDDLDKLAEMAENGQSSAEITEKLDLALDITFPQSESACENDITHRRCPYYECCWSSVVGVDPIGSGLFKARTPYRGLDKEEEPESNE